MKALLFDLDNTLVEFKHMFDFWEPHFRETLLSHGVQATEKEAMHILTSGMINNMLSDLMVDIHAFWADFNIIDFKARRRGLETGEITLYEDAVPTLDSLKEEYLAIVSNTHLDCVMMEMEYLGLSPYFRKVAAYTGKENPKPHPQLAHAALDGRPFSQIFVIGDARADILCGKVIGAKTIHVDRLGEKVESDFSVKSLGEIPSLVN
jgi:HAD superfamily hydrolase (TIGR01509 family)